MRMRLPCLAPLLLVAGCVAAQPVPPLASPTPTTTETSAAPLATASPPLVVGGVSFKPPTLDELTQACTPIAPTKVQPPNRGQYELSELPRIQNSISSAKQLENGNQRFNVIFRAPAAWGAQVLAAFQVGHTTVDANAPRASIQPVLSAWASDAALLTQYELIPNLGAQRAGTAEPYDPAIVKDEAAILANVGWPLAYTSATRKEVLFVFPSGLVALERWSPQEQEAALVTITKDQAIARLAAALPDRTAQSEEARTGLDYFLGVPYAGSFPSIPFNTHDDLQPNYDAPPGTVWEADLEYQYAGKPVWHVIARYNGLPAIFGLVDAHTGTLIRFSRSVHRDDWTATTPSPFVPSQAPLRLD